MLNLKHIAVSSFNENLAYIHRDCVAYKVDDIKTLTKVEIHGGVKPIFAFLQIVDDAKLVKPNELGLNTEAFELINLPEGANISLTLSPPPPSLVSIKRKIAGNILSAGEYAAIINDIAAKRYSNMDIASFLVASGSFMTASEVLAMTEALIGDNTIRWDNEGIVVDHHCFGGVPGNKTDIIITAIVAAYGFFGISCLIGLTNMVMMSVAGKKNKEILKARITELSIVGEMALWVGLALMTVGTFLGAVWANESWGRYWGWDPKETWALITMVVYAVVTHLHLVKRWNSLWLFNLASVIAFASVLMTFFGVNYFLSGMHSYGQNDNVHGIFTYLYIALGVVVILAVLSYRRWKMKV